MKRKDLKGTWQEAVERFENCWAPDILGWWYSRHCLGEKLDMEMVLRDAKEECPPYAAGCLLFRADQGVCNRSDRIDFPALYLWGAVG